jgi:hypothetical protein
VREWVETQEAFIRATEEGESVRAALEKLLSNRGTYGGQRCTGVDALLVRWST